MVAVLWFLSDISRSTEKRFFFLSSWIGGGYSCCGRHVRAANVCLQKKQQSKPYHCTISVEDSK